MLYLPELFILPLQLLLVDTVTLHLSQDALVVEVVDGTVDFGTKVVVVLEDLELPQGVSAEGSGRGEGGGLERLDVLVMIPIYHSVDEGVFAELEFNIFCGFHFAARETYVEGDIVSSFVQYIPLQDFRSWSIIFPSKPLISLLPFVGWSIITSSSW